MINRTVIEKGDEYIVSKQTQATEVEVEPELMERILVTPRGYMHSEPSQLQRAQFRKGNVHHQPSAHQYHQQPTVAPSPSSPMHSNYSAASLLQQQQLEADLALARERGEEKELAEATTRLSELPYSSSTCSWGVLLGCPLCPLSISV